MKNVLCVISSLYVIKSIAASTASSTASDEHNARWKADKKLYGAHRTA